MIQSVECGVIFAGLEIIFTGYTNATKKIKRHALFNCAVYNMEKKFSIALLRVKCPKFIAKNLMLFKVHSSEWTARITELIYIYIFVFFMLYR